MAKGVKFQSVPLPELVKDSTMNQSSRTGHPVHLVVVHDTEGGYDGAIATLKNPGTEASAHVVLREDGKEATQLVPWARKAWSCMAFNSISDNIEIAGFARRQYPDYQLRVAARITAFRLHKRGLPPVFVPSSKVATAKGFTFHSELGIAGGGHTDPGFLPAQRARFISLVQQEFAHGKFRPSWGE